MNLKELHNTNILLLGKSRSFAPDELEAQLRFHGIGLTKELDDSVKVVIEGAMMSPYEQNISDALYEKKRFEFVNIDLLERELALHIDETTLLMSLKLSKNRERLIDFIKNATISDALFLKLLKLYSWQGESFFENDENRDVSAALIVRFYKNIERNHNVQYATTGLLHLIAQSDNEALLEAISLLEPLQRAMGSDLKDTHANILSALATNHYTPRSVLKMFVQKGSREVKILVAMRNDCDAAMQKELCSQHIEGVCEALTYNSKLDKSLVVELIENPHHAKNIAKHIDLDEELFHLLKEEYALELAQNATTTPAMQEALVALHKNDVMIALANNASIDTQIVAELLCEDSHEIRYALYANAATPKESLEEAYNNRYNHQALANNPSTPSKILELLANSDDPKVLLGLAKNPSTPVAILYQLQLDGRFERAVKENVAFGKHIQTENIGWEI
ncbi:MAG: hypothetical protein IE916_02475 [Epsilonproteobacteria bacterium]|nr:hypothetical protein [Campylobacterota bacterium]